MRWCSLIFSEQLKNLSIFCQMSHRVISTPMCFVSFLSLHCIKTEVIFLFRGLLQTFTHLSHVVASLFLVASFTIMACQCLILRCKFFFFVDHFSFFLTCLTASSLSFSSSLFSNSLSFQQPLVIASLFLVPSHLSSLSFPSSLLFQQALFIQQALFHCLSLSVCFPQL